MEVRCRNDLRRDQSSFPAKPIFGECSYQSRQQRHWRNHEFRFHPTWNVNDHETFQSFQRGLPVNHDEDAFRLWSQPRLFGAYVRHSQRVRWNHFENDASFHLNQARISRRRLGQLAYVAHSNLRIQHRALAERSLLQDLRRAPQLSLLTRAHQSHFH